MRAQSRARTVIRVMMNKTMTRMASSHPRVSVGFRGLAILLHATSVAIGGCMPKWSVYVVQISRRMSYLQALCNRCLRSMSRKNKKH